MRYSKMRGFVAAIVTASLAGATHAQSGGSPGFVSQDLFKLQAIGEARIAPDGARIAYSLVKYDGPGRPRAETWIMEVATGRSVRLGGEASHGSGPHWSPDGRWIAYSGQNATESGLMLARPDGSPGTLLAPLSGTNHPLPSSGDEIAWAPDSSRVAFISSTPGPEQNANGDPMVITRYLYKPTASEGLTRFNDNRRLHIFVADVASKVVRQLTSGNFYEHSIDWSPRGDEILFVSNREPDADRVFNYDVFAVKVGDGSIRRLTDTKNAEYEPSWSPDGRQVAYLGTKRTLTSSETTMEDTHVWVMNADGSERREVGSGIDDRQAAPAWSPDGRALYFTVQHHGSTELYRWPLAGGEPDVAVGGIGNVMAWSIAAGPAIAYSWATPQGPPELYLTAGGKARALTTNNKALLAGRTVAPVEPFTFKSFDGMEIEAYLTRPLNQTAASTHPLIVMMHGGPHGQQGPSFNPKSQVYAAHGWATLMVNYRGSTGYGQKLADAIFKDQNGGEAKDVLSGVDAALERYKWLDSRRLGLEGGSYGGQLANWIITQTDRFKAAIPTAGIANLVSFNYLAYYHDYLAVEFGAYPHEAGLMDLLWERSPIRYVSKVKTPTLFIHGENDNDVPIAEAEQFYIALKDVGVETEFLRYPREGHGLRETGHVVDSIDRSIVWYERHFGSTTTPVTAKPGR